MSAAAPLSVRFIFLIALGKRLFLEQRLTISDWDLVIIRMNLRKGEEAMAVSAIIDECRLQRRLDASNLRQINVAA